MTYQLPPTDSGRTYLLPSDKMCKPTQTPLNTTDGYPCLKARPGDHVLLKYQENGHITLPAAEKPSTGTISVYGTQHSSSNDTLLAIHHVWNSNGTGGRGVLLNRASFDDGSCYQANNGGDLSQYRASIAQPPHSTPEGLNLWCGIPIFLPTSLIIGQDYTLYWVWDWPTIGVNGSVVKQQIYTTCMDITIVQELPSDDDAQATQGWNASITATSFVETNTVTAVISTDTSIKTASTTNVLSSAVSQVPPSSLEVITTMSTTSSTITDISTDVSTFESAAFMESPTDSPSSSSVPIETIFSTTYPDSGSIVTSTILRTTLVQAMSTVTSTTVITAR